MGTLLVFDPDTFFIVDMANKDKLKVYGATLHIVFMASIL